jgi:hypothetical protein
MIKFTEEGMSKASQQPSTSSQDYDSLKAQIMVTFFLATKYFLN